MHEVRAAKPRRGLRVSERPARWWIAALGWAACSAALLAGGFAALVAWIAWHARASPGPMQLQAWIALASRVLEQALLPRWLWRRLGPGAFSAARTSG